MLLEKLLSLLEYDESTDSMILNINIINSMKTIILDEYSLTDTQRSNCPTYYLDEIISTLTQNGFEYLTVSRDQFMDIFDNIKNCYENNLSNVVVSTGKLLADPTIVEGTYFEQKLNQNSSFEIDNNITFDQGILLKLITSDSLLDTELDFTGVSKDLLMESLKYQLVLAGEMDYKDVIASLSLSRQKILIPTLKFVWTLVFSRDKLGKLNILIKDGGDIPRIPYGLINASDIDGYTPFLWACKNKKYDICLEILTLDVYRNSDGSPMFDLGQLVIKSQANALAIACNFGMKDVAQGIITLGNQYPLENGKNSANLGLVMSESMTPLILAIGSKMEETANMLLDSNESNYENIYGGFSAFSTACDNGLEDIALKIMKIAPNNVLINAVNTWDGEKRNTPLISACENDLWKVIVKLIKMSSTLPYSPIFPQGMIHHTNYEGESALSIMLLKQDIIDENEDDFTTYDKNSRRYIKQIIQKIRDLRVG